MNRLKKGDIVGRKSYNKDVIFEIVGIIKLNLNEKIYILKGITERIEADSPKEDLELIDKRIVNYGIEKLDKKINERIEKYINKNNRSIKNIFKLSNVYLKNKKRNREYKKISFGTILHLDGDKRYGDKSYRYYKSLGLNAIVRNVPENRQFYVIRRLLERYNPDIIVLTGHDGMIKKGTEFNNIYNYRNSKYFINTVNEARRWSNENNKNLAIFAGACQSYYEGIMSAGANFASSPKRIMIDFIDPLIVAERIATTENSRYLTIKDIEEELRDGRAGVDGIGALGRKKVEIIQ